MSNIPRTLHCHFPWGRYSAVQLLHSNISATLISQTWAILAHESLAPAAHQANRWPVWSWAPVEPVLMFYCVLLLQSLLVSPLCYKEYQAPVTLLEYPWSLEALASHLEKYTFPGLISIFPILLKLNSIHGSVMFLPLSLSFSWVSVWQKQNTHKRKNFLAGKPASSWRQMEETKHLSHWVRVSRVSHNLRGHYLSVATRCFSVTQTTARITPGWTHAILSSPSCWIYHLEEKQSQGLHLSLCL